jgi:L-rhamnose isomerase
LAYVSGLEQAPAWHVEKIARHVTEKDLWHSRHVSLLGNDWTDDDVVAIAADVSRNHLDFPDDVAAIGADGGTSWTADVAEIGGWCR